MRDAESEQKWTLITAFIKRLFHLLPGAVSIIVFEIFYKLIFFLLYQK